MYDPTDEKLNSLTPDLQLRAYWMIRIAREAGIPLMIISGRRSPSENLAVGGAAHSRHLQGRAFDVQVAGYTRDEVPDWWWASLGSYAETQLGLRWGGRFSTYDPNHFDI